MFVWLQMVDTEGGQNGVVGIVTCCGPDSLEVESQWGLDIPGLSRPAPKPTQTL